MLGSMQPQRRLPFANELGNVEPFRWMLHGGPGTGKSHVLRILKRELFERILGWDMSVNFQIVALQAVMAQLLEGDTIHHSLGIKVCKKWGLGGR